MIDTEQTRLLGQLETLHRRFGELAAGYRMAGERHRAMASDKVAIECRHSADALRGALKSLREAKPMPERVVRIATLADGRPAHERMNDNAGGQRGSPPV